MRILTLSLLLLPLLALAVCTPNEVPPAKTSTVELTTYNFDYKGGGKGSLTGTVSNGTAEAVSGVRVKFDVLDSDGNRLGTVTPNTLVGPPKVTSIGPGETWSFTFEINGYAGRARSVKPVGVEVR